MILSSLPRNKRGSVIEPVNTTMSAQRPPVGKRERDRRDSDGRGPGNDDCRGDRTGLGPLERDDARQVEKGRELLFLLEEGVGPLGDSR